MITGVLRNRHGPPSCSVGEFAGPFDWCEQNSPMATNRRGAKARKREVHEHPTPTGATVKRLYASALGCAKPGCVEPLYKSGSEGEKEELNSRVAHIHARRKGGARWLPGMSSEANRSYENLVVLCLFHADAVDWNEADFPAQLLRDWKREHVASVKRAGGVTRAPMAEAQLTEVMARSFIPTLVDSLREVLPFSPRSRTRVQALERARTQSRARSLERLTPVPAPLRASVLAWSEGSSDFRVEVPVGCIRVLVAPMGSGKSEIAESWWLEGLDEAERDESVGLPVWLEARQVVERGLDQVLIEEIGGDPVRPYRVVIDDLDRVGATEARHLMKAARRLTLASPHVRVLGTSRPGAVLIEGGDEEIPVPEWSVERGLALLRLLVVDIAPHEWWADETVALVQRPLTILALAARLNAGRNARVTRTALLAELANLIVERERPDADEQIWELMIRLAAVLLRYGVAVRTRNFAPRPLLWRLYETGLVVEHDGALSFALPLFEQYFGAQAISSGVMPLAEASGPGLFGRWRYAIASTVAAEAPADAESTMVQIARIDAAAASWVFDEVAHREDYGRAGEELTGGQVRAQIESGCPALAQESDLSMAAGRWLREPVEALLTGFGPLRPHLAAHHDGALCRWGVRIQDGYVLLAKSRNETEPSLVRIEDPDRESLRRAGWGRQERFRFPTGDLARWRWARRQVGSDLASLLQAGRMPTRPSSVLTRERIWYLACFITSGRYQHSLDFISLDELRGKLAKVMEQVDSSVLVRHQWPGYTADSADFRWLDEQLRHQEGKVIERPWPRPDLPDQYRRSFAARYSPQAAVGFVASVMQAAVDGYRELVETNIPTCSANLATYAILPPRVRALVQLFDDEQEFSSSVHYLIMPSAVMAEGMRSVDVEWCDSIEGSAASHFAALFTPGADRIPKGSISDNSGLPMNWRRPASNYAYQWLINDLSKVGWVDPFSVTFTD